MKTSSQKKKLNKNKLRDYKVCVAYSTEVFLSPVDHEIALELQEKDAEVVRHHERM